MRTASGRRRYLTNFEVHRVPNLFTDVLVVGSGVAGLQAALEASSHADVLVVTKGGVEESATAWAQGGIAAPVEADDSPRQHAEDTVAVGCGLAHAGTVGSVVADAAGLIAELEMHGARFDRTGGALRPGREGGHTHARIVHTQDATGVELQRVLLEQVRAAPRIRMFEMCFTIDLLTHQGRAVGAVTFHPKYGHQLIWATTTVLATGGCGHVYRETSNPAIATGDGVAMALRAGAVLRDMEMLQFHPTTLYVAGAARELISEAVRGDGAYLVDRQGMRFMPACDERAELAPRDIVSRAITAEMKRTSSPCVYLDVRHFSPGHFAQRFPRLDRLCREFDIRPERDRIPVRPSAHYVVGGVVVDEYAQTHVPGLLACGEVASTGLHGANRLASNSLLEGLVYGRWAGRRAAQRASENGRIDRPLPLNHILPHSSRTALDLRDVCNSLTSVMSRNAAVERSGDRLRETLEIIDFWSRYVMDKVFDEPRDWETQNLLTTALTIATGAATRCESRGVHYRTDFPQSEDQWCCHIDQRRADDMVQVSTQPVTDSEPALA